MQRKRSQSHNLRNAAIVIIALILIISVVVVAYQIGPRSGPPKYSDISITPTNASSPCIFSVQWSSDTNVSGYIFGSNNTGVFTNDTWKAFYDFVNQTAGYSRVTETLNDTISNTVSWAFWCNDTKNRWSEIPLQSDLVVTKVLLDVSNWGNIEIQPFGDMPITSGNFLNLVRTGVYNGTNFSRVVPGFVIQGGDASVNGIIVHTIPDELPNKHSNLRGYVAMAKTNQPNSATDQFFIDLSDSDTQLDSNYSVFGMVISGMNVVDQISLNLPASANATSYDGPPGTPVIITTARFVN
jgi:cyclophilin family peptidyl-prolyl cis-trans isomerase